MISDPTDPNAADGGPAYPLYLGVYAGTAPPHIKGMSLRDYFASTATSFDIEHYRGGWLSQILKFEYSPVEARYRYADEMLKHRKEKKP